jgi:uncharacterized damage-inducible protein DinB
MPFAKTLLFADVRRSAWANQNLLAACSRLTPQERERDIRISHASILFTLAHIYDGERVWLDCLQTTPDRGTWRLPPGPSPQYSLDALKQIWPTVWNGFHDWFERLPESALDIELTLQLPGGVVQPFPRWKILRHVLDHSIMHRGQVVGMIRMLGHEPPSTSPMDYYLVSAI